MRRTLSGRDGLPGRVPTPGRGVMRATAVPIAIPMLPPTVQPWISDGERTDAVEPGTGTPCGRVVDEALPVVVRPRRVGVPRVGGDPPQPEGISLAFDKSVLYGSGRAKALVAMARDGFARGLLNDLKVPPFGVALARVAHGQLERYAVRREETEVTSFAVFAKSHKSCWCRFRIHFLFVCITVVP